MEILNKDYTADEYAAFAIKANEMGKKIEITEDGDVVMVEPTMAELNYADNRLMEFPPIGDMIDAICKAEMGDRTELDELLALREEIKAKYPKA